MNRTLRKTEILRGYRAFTAVISGGRMVAVPPVRLYTILNPSASPEIAIGFTVARGIRGAVRRNRIRRILREAYRLQKEPVIRALADSRYSVQCVLMFVGPPPRHAATLRLQAVQEPVEQVLLRLAHAIGSSA